MNFRSKKQQGNLKKTEQGPNLTLCLILALFVCQPKSAAALSNCNASPDVHGTAGNWQQLTCSGQASKDLTNCVGKCNITYTPMGCQIAGESTYIYGVYCSDLPETEDPHDTAAGGSKHCNAAPTGGAGWMQGNCNGDISHSGEMSGVAPTCTEACITTPFEANCKLNTVQLFTSTQAYSRWCPDLPEIGAKKAVACSVSASPTSAPVGQAVSLTFSSDSALYGLSSTGLRLEVNKPGEYTISKIGEDVLTFTAYDAAGNTGSCGVSVTGTKTVDGPIVVDPGPPNPPPTNTGTSTSTSTSTGSDLHLQTQTEPIQTEQSALLGTSAQEIQMSQAAQPANGQSTTPAASKTDTHSPSVGVAVAGGAAKEADGISRQEVVGLVHSALGAGHNGTGLDATTNPVKAGLQDHGDQGRSKNETEKPPAAEFKKGISFSPNTNGETSSNTGNQHSDSGAPPLFPVSTPGGSPTGSKPVPNERHQASLTVEKANQEQSKSGPAFQDSSENSSEPSLFARVSQRYRAVSRSMMKAPFGLK